MAKTTKKKKERVEVHKLIEWDDNVTDEELEEYRSRDEEDDDYIDPWYIQPMDLIR